MLCIIVCNVIIFRVLRIYRQVLGAGQLVAHMLTCNWWLRDHWERFIILGREYFGVVLLECALDYLAHPSVFVVAG